MPSRPLTGRVRRARSRVQVSLFMLRVLPLTIDTAIKPATNNSSGEEFQLPDDSDVVSDSPQVEPTPDRSAGLLTSQSNTLGTATLDSNLGDLALFFEKFKNKDGEKMRRCTACL